MKHKKKISDRSSQRDLLDEIERMYVEFSTDNLNKVGDIVSSSFISLETSMSQYSLFVSTLYELISRHGDDKVTELAYEYKMCWELICDVYHPNAQNVLLSKALTPIFELVQKENQDIYTAYKQALRKSLTFQSSAAPVMQSSHEEMLQTVDEKNRKLASIDGKLDSKCLKSMPMNGFISSFA